MTDQTLLGQWKIEDGVLGDIGIELELLEGGHCRLSNGIRGNWRMQGENLIIEAQPFAFFHIRPRGNQMTGGWVEIAGKHGTMSNVILRRKDQPIQTKVIVRVFAHDNKVLAQVYSDGNIRNQADEALGRVDIQGRIYALSGRYWGQVTPMATFFKKVGTIKSCTWEVYQLRVRFLPPKAKSGGMLLLRLRTLCLIPYKLWVGQVFCSTCWLSYLALLTYSKVRLIIAATAQPK